MSPATIEPTAQEPCAECQPPQSAEQPDADPTEATARPDDPPRFMDAMTEETLARLKRLAPDEMDELDGKLGDEQCVFFSLINKAIGSDWTKTADVLEFAQNWSPDTALSPERRDAIKRISSSLPGLSTVLLQKLADAHEGRLGSKDETGQRAEQKPDRADKHAGQAETSPGNAADPPEKSADVRSLCESAANSPNGIGAAIARIITLLTECSPEYLGGLVDEITYQNELNKDKDEDENHWRTTRFAIGERMKAEHLFRGWATNIRNLMPVLYAITCFTDEDERETKFDDQDGMGIDQMVNFVMKELKVLAKDCDLAGDHGNPRFVTSSGHVWRLNTTATLTEKPADAKGGAS